MTAAEETRRFRHRATHDYDNFDIALSQPSVDAAKRIADGLLDAVEEFRGIIDPPGVGR